MKNMPIIDNYSFGEIIIDGNEHGEDVCIMPDGVEAGWWREKVHSLVPADLEEAIDAKPEILIIGTGSYGEMEIPEETREYIKDKGIKLEVHGTEKASQVYNEHREEHKVVACLHLTC